MATGTSSSSASFNPLHVVEAAEMLGIHLEDLQLGNDTLGDREIEMFDDTLSLGEDGPITKQESEYTDVESFDISQTSKKKLHYQFYK